MYIKPYGFGFLPNPLNAITLQAATIGNVGSGHLGSNVTAIHSFQGPVGVYGANTGSFTTTTTTGNAFTSLTNSGFANVKVGNLTVQSLSIGGAINISSLNGTPIGNTTPSTGGFTYLVATTGHDWLWSNRFLRRLPKD